MAITIKGLFLNNSGEATTNPTETDNTTDAEDLKKRHPPRIKKTIANCRYAFDNDPTIRGIIFNNITTTLKNFRIECEDEKVREYIQDKVDNDWDLKNIFSQVLLKWQRDGPCFIEKGIIDGSIQIRFLAFDDDKYKFKIIRNPQTEKIIGFKQKYQVAKDLNNWQTKKFDEIGNEFEDKEANYTPDKIIYPVLFEEAGKAKSLIMTLLNHIDSKWTLERFMLSSAHKAGQMIGITVGQDNVSNRGQKNRFVKKLIEIFRNPVEKDVAVVPEGVTVDTIGNNQLPDLPLYLKYFRNEIFLALQTPESLFSSESSNRSTAEVQSDDKTGYAVFVEFLRFKLKKYFEKELIDEELKLKRMTKSIGSVKIHFDEEEEPTPLETEDEAVKADEEQGIDEDTGMSPEVLSPDEKLAGTKAAATA